MLGERRIGKDPNSHFRQDLQDFQDFQDGNRRSFSCVSCFPAWFGPLGVFAPWRENGCSARRIPPPHRGGLQKAGSQYPMSKGWNLASLHLGVSMAVRNGAGTACPPVEEPLSRFSDPPTKATPQAGCRGFTRTWWMVGCSSLVVASNRMQVSV